MKYKALSAIKKYDMIRAGDRITVALSGGADSVALLCVLSELGRELEITLSACHINHRLRGEESDSDERFCRGLCLEMGIPFTALAVDVRGYCLQNGLSTEEGARDLRYRALRSASAGGKIATAHTLSDNAETMLFNLSRGAALEGICGIPPVRDDIIRPLISCTREEIEQYLAAKGQRYVTDSSNLSDDYSRNRLRHHVVPMLREITPSFEQAAGRAASALREDSLLLAGLAEKLLQSAYISEPAKAKKGFERFASIYPIQKRYDAAALLSAERPLRLRALRSMLKGFGLGYDAGRLEAMERVLQQGGCYNLGKDTAFECAEGTAALTRKIEPFDFSSCEIELLQEKFAGKYGVGGGFLLSLRPISSDEIKLFVNKRSLAFKNALDCDKIIGTVALRKRNPGDSICLAGRGFNQSFKKLLNASGIPIAVRDSLAVISDESGPVWLEGFGVAQRAAVTADTRRACLLEISGEMTK